VVKERRMAHQRNAYKVLVPKPLAKRPFDVNEGLTVKWILENSLTYEVIKKCML
jgi:hypothetical protein